MVKKDSLLQRYRTLGLPSAFSASATLQNSLPFLSRKKVEHELSKIDSATLHKKTARPKTNPVYVHRRRHVMEMDLIDIAGLKPWNDGITFLLVVVDCFSRYICIEPLTSKTGLTVTRALTKNFDSCLPPPVGKYYRFDRGTEFLNVHVKRLLQDRGIEYFHPSNKPAHVERVNQTIQSILYRYLEEFETKRYIDQLPNIAKTYNTRQHRIIRMSPIEADLPSNQLLVQEALARYYVKREKKLKRGKPKFVIDQPVRIKANRGIFARSYMPVFKTETFRIKSVITHLPRVMYNITTWDRDELIDGRFYEEELTAQNSETFKIENILDTRTVGRRAESLVKWVGYKNPTWVLTSGIQKLKSG